MEAIYVIAVSTILIIAFGAFVLFLNRFRKEIGTRYGLLYFIWEHFFYEPIYFFFRIVPGAPGMLVRYVFFKVFLKKLGRSVTIYDCVRIKNPEMFSIGDYSGIQPNCYFESQGGITIGKWTRIAYGVKMISSDHIRERLDIPIKKQGILLKKIHIGDDVWIGTGAVILGGVKIGNGSIIGANSVVWTDVPANSIFVGNPGRVISARKDHRYDKSTNIA